ncbi:MAG: serine/threonine protein kinase [Victivallales bacterium]|nr:serine/threonine protein kinase [Victivallales bacterium]
MPNFSFLNALHNSEDGNLLFCKRYEALSSGFRSGMGLVYKCHDIVDDTQVCIRLLPKEITGDEARLSELMECVESLQTLVHPCIALIQKIDYVPETREYFVVMESFDGVAFNQFLHQKFGAGEKQRLAELMPVFQQIAEALDFAHRHGLVHQDIKSENILVNKRGYVKLLSFGLPEFFQSKKTLLSEHYRAPELIKGLPASPSSDQFAFAVLVFEALYDQHPFASQTIGRTLQEAILYCPPRFSSDLSDQVNIKALRKALAKSPKDRFNTCQDFLRDLYIPPKQNMFLWRWREFSRSAGAKLWKVCKWIVLLIIAYLLITNGSGLWRGVQRWFGNNVQHNSKKTANVTQRTSANNQRARGDSDVSNLPQSFCIEGMARGESQQYEGVYQLVTSGTNAGYYVNYTGEIRFSAFPKESASICSRHYSKEFYKYPYAVEFENKKYDDFIGTGNFVFCLNRDIATATRVGTMSASYGLKKSTMRKNDVDFNWGYIRKIGNGTVDVDEIDMPQQSETTRVILPQHRTSVGQSLWTKDMEEDFSKSIEGASNPSVDSDEESLPQAEMEEFDD